MLEHINTSIIILIVQLVFLRGLYTKNLFVVGLAWTLSLYLIIKKGYKPYKLIIPLLTVITTSNYYRKTSFTVSGIYLILTILTYFYPSLRTLEPAISTLYIGYAISLDRMMITHFKNKKKIPIHKSRYDDPPNVPSDIMLVKSILTTRPNN